MCIFLDQLPQFSQPMVISRGVSQFIQGAEVQRKALEAIGSWVVGFGLTRVKMIFDDNSRRKTRVRLVQEAADVLHLREQLGNLRESAEKWRVVHQIAPHLDDFALENLAKVEVQLRAIREADIHLKTRSTLERVLLLYKPQRRWLFLFHALYFAVLGSAVTIVNAIGGVMRDQGMSLQDAVLRYSPSIVGLVLAALLFNYLANRNDRQLADRQTSGVPDQAKRDIASRLLLQFAPHGPVMWAAHILFFLGLGITIRYTPTLLHQQISGWDWLIPLFLGLVFVVLPMASMNALANFLDLRHHLSPEEMPAERRALIREVLLLYMPAKSWLLPLHGLFYLSLPFSALVLLVAFASSPGWDVVVVLVVAAVIANGSMVLLANGMDGILQLCRTRNPELAAV